MGPSFCGVVLNVNSSIGIILLRERERDRQRERDREGERGGLFGLLKLYFCCRVAVICVSSSRCHWVSLRFVIMTFPGPEVMLTSTEHEISTAHKN